MEEYEQYDDPGFAEEAESPDSGYYEVAAYCIESQITALAFDAMEDVLWAGTEDGGVATLTCPSLHPYAHWNAHGEPICALVPFGPVCLSVSASSARLQDMGGPALFKVNARAADPNCAFTAASADVVSGTLLLGTAGGELTRVSGRDGDILAEAQVSRSDGDGISALAVVPGGLTLAVGMTSGSVLFYDLRMSLSAAPAASAFAHQGPVRSIACNPKGDLIATTGYFGHPPHRLPDRRVCLLDARRGYTEAAPAMHPMGASWAAFVPLRTATASLCSDAGQFLSIDILSGSLLSHFQVDTAGAAILTAALSPSGDCYAFGDEAGVVRLWSQSEEPRVQLYGARPVSPPHPFAFHGPHLSEASPFSVAPPLDPQPYLAALHQEGAPLPPFALLSDDSLNAPIPVGLPPRTVHDDLVPHLRDAPTLAPGVAVADNPAYSRGVPKGTPTAESAALRSSRAQARHRRRKKGAGDDPDAAQMREAMLGELLPQRLCHVEVRLPSSAGRAAFSEFDFSFFNRTRFAGLENDAANAYCNAVLQALFFTPSLCSLLLDYQPMPFRDASLTDELAFLSHMLRTSPPGSPCQAANFVAALRQNREAIGLGLLESPAKDMAGITGTRGDLEATASVVRHLGTRAQALMRFLLQQMLAEDALPPGAIKAIVTSQWSQRTTCLKDPSAVITQVQSAEQIDLAYPDRASALTSPLGTALPPPARDLPREAINPIALPLLRAAYPPNASWRPPRPSFSDVLRASLVKETTMRAWFNEERGYQPVSQDRVPLHLPHLLVVGAALQDPADVAFWQEDDAGEPWLPAAVEVAFNPTTRAVRVGQGPSALALLGDQEHDRDDQGMQRVVYDLTAVVSHMHDPRPAAEGEDRPGSLADPKREGHLVTHLRLHSCYLHGKRSTATFVKPATPGLSPLPANWEARGRERGEEGGGEVKAGVAEGKEEREPSTPPPSHLPSSSRRLLSPGDDGELGHGDWLLLNDFAVTRSSEGEARGICGGLKAPALLLFTRVDPASPSAATPSTSAPHPRIPAELPPSGRIVMDARTFAALCNDPPLNASSVDLLPPRFQPLDMGREAPRQGMLVAIDTEFVQMAPAECVYRDGAQVVLRPPRLSLARISVVRGDPGDRTGTCFIDDHVRRVEPVWDYLTRFSGVSPGDLDVGTSRHHLTSLKKAYLKLRYLVDCGCVLVGHGLRMDFKMINIVVPPEQIVDTVELFHFKHQRKLSLKFLASYLLRVGIQQSVHDSIEDARTALLLYRKYLSLVERGALEETLLGMYRFGKAHGWDPAQWDEAATRQLQREGEGQGEQGGPAE